MKAEIQRLARGFSDFVRKLCLEPVLGSLTSDSMAGVSLGQLAITGRQAYPGGWATRWTQGSQARQLLPQDSHSDKLQKLQVTHRQEKTSSNLKRAWPFRDRECQRKLDLFDHLCVCFSLFNFWSKMLNLLTFCLLFLYKYHFIITLMRCCRNLALVYIN